MVGLTEAQMPNHTHTMNAAPAPGNQDDAGNTVVLSRTTGANVYGGASNLEAMADQVLPSAGGSQDHNNLQPFLVMNFIIALVGLYPSRS